MNAFTVPEGAGRNAFAEIEEETRTTVLLPLHVEDVHVIGGDRPERHKLRCTSHVALQLPATRGSSAPKGGGLPQPCVNRAGRRFWILGETFRVSCPDDALLQGSA